MTKIVEISKELLLSSATRIDIYYKIDGISETHLFGVDDEKIELKRLFRLDQPLLGTFVKNDQRYGIYFRLSMKENVFDLCICKMKKTDTEYIPEKWMTDEQFKELNFSIFYAHDKDIYKDEILVVDKNIFNTNEEMALSMAFFDGFAIEKRNDNILPLVMLYPTLSTVMENKRMRQSIINYGQGMESIDDITPYNVALRFGKLIRMKKLIQ